MIPCWAKYCRPCWLCARVVTISIAVALGKKKKGNRQKPWQKSDRAKITTQKPVIYNNWVILHSRISQLFCFYSMIYFITWPRHHLLSVLRGAEKWSRCWHSNRVRWGTPPRFPPPAESSKNVKVSFKACDVNMYTLGNRDKQTSYTLYLMMSLVAITSFMTLSRSLWNNLSSPGLEWLSLDNDLMAWEQQQTLIPL